MSLCRVLNRMLVVLLVSLQILWYKKTQTRQSSICCSQTNGSWSSMMAFSLQGTTVGVQWIHCCVFEQINELPHRSKNTVWTQTAWVWCTHSHIHTQWEAVFPAVSEHHTDVLIQRTQLTCWRWFHDFMAMGQHYSPFVCWLSGKSAPLPVLNVRRTSNTSVTWCRKNVEAALNVWLHVLHPTHVRIYFLCSLRQRSAEPPGCADLRTGSTWPDLQERHLKHHIY